MPEVKEETMPGEFVFMEGVPFSTMRKNIDLSVLELTDNVFLRCFPAIKKFKSLTELQMRNNRLSETCYRMLFNTIPELELLDLSSSNSDNFANLIG